MSFESLTEGDSVDVTSSGRSFQVRGPTTGKARLVGDGCQLNRRHCQTVGASRTERSAARQICDIVEWTKVLRRESVQDFVDENSNLVLNSLRHAQPVEADSVLTTTTSNAARFSTSNLYLNTTSFRVTSESCRNV